MNKEKIDEYLNDTNNLVPIITHIPNNTCRVAINVLLMDDDGEMHEASTVMNLPEIVEARINGEEWEDENVKYCLTEDAIHQIEEKGLEQFAKEVAEQIKESRKR